MLSIMCPNVVLSATISSVQFNITVKHFKWLHALLFQDTEKYTQLLNNIFLNMQVTILI